MVAAAASSHEWRSLPFLLLLAIPAHHVLALVCGFARGHRLTDARPLAAALLPTLMAGVAAFVAYPVFLEALPRLFRRY